MPSPCHLLGISAYDHDAAAALLYDGRIVATAQEEHITRKKNDPDFPRRAIESCLRRAGLTPGQPDAVVFYDKPIVKFARSWRLRATTCLTIALGFVAGSSIAQNASNGFWQAQSIYQIITDRFYDGDPSNNNAEGNYNPGQQQVGSRRRLQGHRAEAGLHQSAGCDGDLDLTRRAQRPRPVSRLCRAGLLPGGAALGQPGRLAAHDPGGARARACWSLMTSS